MADFTADLATWIGALPPIYIYAVITLVAYLENVVPPIPGDVVVAFGGYLAAQSIIYATPLFIATSLSSVLGFMTMYAIGKKVGPAFVEKYSDTRWAKWTGMKHLPKVQVWMAVWGQWVIVVNRFLSGARTVISFASGYSNTRMWLTIVNSTISSLLWNAVLIIAGWQLGANWARVAGFLSVYGRFVLLLMGIGVMIRLAYWYFRQRKKN